MKLIGTLKTNNSITLIATDDSGVQQSQTVVSAMPNWQKIVDTWKNGSEDELVNLVFETKKIEDYTEGNVYIKDHSIFYKHMQLKGYEIQKALDFMDQGKDYKPILKFIDRSFKNENPESIRQLYSFLEKNEMPLTPEGKVLGYKGVSSNYWSVRGNKDITPIQGRVDDDGKIYNGIGEVIELKRSDVVFDENATCSVGLHIGSYNYAHRHGHKVIIVEFDPADAVSVPKTESSDKLRVCKYKVIKDYDEKLSSTLDDKSIKTENEKPQHILIKRGPNFNTGYTQGLKDGKNHDVRQFSTADAVSEYIVSQSDYEVDSEIIGYDFGYAYGRYGKTKTEKDLYMIKNKKV